MNNTIIAQMRNPSAKAKQLRRFGIVPCVICGNGMESSLSIQIEQSIARLLMRTKRNGSKADIMLDGKTYPCLIKDMEYNSLSNEVVHIGFQLLAPDVKVNSVADVILLNKDKVGGILELIQMQIPHAALPADLIDTVEVNLENMPVGTSLTIRDIPALCSDRIELQCDPGNLVLRISDKNRPAMRAE